MRQVIGAARFTLAVPFLLTSDITREVGFAIYGRRRTNGGRTL